jgi:hypothetical protein
VDPRHLDALAKRLGTLGSRRTALGGILAGLLLPLEAAARGKGKPKQIQKQKRNGYDKDQGKDQKGKGKGRNKGKEKKGKDQRSGAAAQAEVCWRAGACSPKKGANVSQCDLAGYAPSTPLNCTGCNASRANLRGANLTGANLTKANLSGACLVDANLRGATITNTTNLYNAIFCRTTMPDGSVNNSGCGSGAACCPTCLREGASCGAGSVGSCCGTSQCRNGACSTCTPTTCEAQGKNCGQIADGCGQPLDCGACTAPQTCGGGGAANVCGCGAATCTSLGKQCGSWPDGCGETLICGPCPANQFCCNGTCALCPCGKVHLANGTCVTPCGSGACGFSPCGCALPERICAIGNIFPHIPCPNGDLDCPLGQFCLPNHGGCRVACPA